MNSILYKACENFAKSLSTDIKRCKSGDIKGYVGRISVTGDKNYDFYVVIPREKLEMVSEIFFGDKDEYDLEDMTKEITNLIIGNSKVIAGEQNIDFEISTPEFLGEYNGIDFDDFICLESGGVKFFILYKEK